MFVEHTADMGHRCKPTLLPANISHLIPAILTCLAALLLSGCSLLRPASPPTATPFPASAFTAGAGTVIARFTQQAGDTAVAQLTAIAAAGTAQAATAAAVPPTAIPAEPSAAPVALDTPTPPPPPATPLPVDPPTPAVPCDQAEFVAHLTLPPDSPVVAGAALTKIWRVRNSGACEWTPAYALVYTSGSLPGGGPSTALPFVVRPGESVDLALTLAAPPYAGLYSGEWLLRSPGGALFGSGPADLPFSLRILASAPAQTANGYDLAAAVCQAAWRSSSGALACPGPAADPNGSVLPVESPVMEGRPAAGWAVVTRPPAAPGSFIQGIFPPYTVQPGDAFLVDTACLQRESGCDLLYQFGYQRQDGGFQELARWRETSDGRSTPVQVDLSLLAGYSPSFSLIVTDQGGLWVGGAWLRPRIQRQPRPVDTTLIWQRQRPDRNECQELRITLDRVAETGDAQAFDCQAGSSNLGGLDLGRLRLEQQEVAQLLAWVRRLASFDGEVYSMINGQPVLAWVDFNGLGDGDATGDDIAAMDALAARLYELIAR